MTARWQVFEHVARTALDASAPRRFAVLRPLKAQPPRARSAGAGASAPAAHAAAPPPSQVELRGLAEGGKPFESPNHPRNAEMGARRLVLPETIYIDRDDFREARASVALPRTPRCAQRPAAVLWRQRACVRVGRRRKRAVAGGRAELLRPCAREGGGLARRRRDHPLRRGGAGRRRRRDRARLLGERGPLAGSETPARL